MCGKLLKAKEIGNCVRLRLIVRNQAKGAAGQSEICLMGRV